MMYKRYSGEFLSLNGVTWRCEILQEADAAFATVGELVFPADQPLVIEWADRAAEEPVCGSTARLRIESPGDRTYIDLYGIQQGQTRLDVYRNNVLYWSGCADTEFYEEPYDKAFRYDVELTFSDFGILNRTPYDLTGRKTFRAILESALSKAKIGENIDETHISTKFTDDTAVSLSALAVASDNFIDEEGEASSYYDVLEGILQPLALKLVQKAGKIYVYDINALVQETATTVSWDGTGSRLGTNTVYNNVKVTFSPYASGDVVKGELDYGDTFGPAWTNLTSQSSGVKYNGGSVPAGKTAPECYSFYLDYDEDHRQNGSWDYNLVGFTLFRSTDTDKCKGLAQLGTRNAFFKINPVIDGSEESGVIGGFYTGGHGNLASGYPVLKGIAPTDHTGDLAMKTERVYLPAMDEDAQDKNYVKVLMDILIDARYNFNEQEDDNNEKGNYEAIKAKANFTQVPVAVVLYDENGTALYHWKNSGIVQYAHPADSIRNTRGEWVSGEASFGDAWLSYYDPENIWSSQGALGWRSNRQNFGQPVFSAALSKLLYLDATSQSLAPWWIFDSFKKAPDGQFLPYPPTGGYLEVRVYNGAWIFGTGEAFNSDVTQTAFHKAGLFSKIRWQMYKLPQVSVVKSNLNFESAETQDVEYSGELNQYAKETLSIDTVVGTTEEAAPTARGLLLRANGSAVQMLKRGGVTDHPEQLLIGTMYSQYADRHTVLTGDISMGAGGLGVYKESAQPADARFLITSERQNVRENVSDVTLVETRTDEYQGN